MIGTNWGDMALFALAVGLGVSWIIRSWRSR